MALKFYKQRDIEEMDVSNIPDEFKRYFESLSYERKKEIYESRPDLCEKIGFQLNSVKSQEANEKSLDTSIEEHKSEEKEPIKENSKEGKNVPDDLSDIKVNYYKNSEFLNVFTDNMEYIEILTIPDGTEKCLIHRTPFIKKQVNFRTNDGTVFMMVLKLCPKCKRAFLENLKAQYNDQKLTERNINHKIYSLDVSMKYLRENQPSYKLEEDEMVYVPETWIETNPKCPIHNIKLYPITCEKRYKDRVIKFKAFYCEKCKKVIVRNAAIANITDLCAQKGIPIIKHKVIGSTTNQPRKKIDVNKNNKEQLSVRLPNYIVEDGKVQKYDYGYSVSYYELGKSDTIVVSDSIYCNIEGHEDRIEEVLILIKVDEKRKGISTYLLKAGYCQECQKYYVEDRDYKKLYSKGRPIVNVFTDLLVDEYNITSGEVFDLENNHLNDLENKIDKKVSKIKSSSGYVSKYKVNELHYDDGGFNFAKDRSIRKYDESLKELSDYKDVPYTYRVDVKSDNNSKTFYLGADNIQLDGNINVISFNSPLGHELVNYKTTKIDIDGKEYDVKLSRRFDIDSAKLYGYTNVKTDEDLIFKAGITDPFLVRVLNIRKKQHNLVDIIATIQENQNNIVEAPYQKNIVVQGCAGSGKTMVLLHRLSSLKYKHKGFDFEGKSLILTPNDNLNLQIKSVADGLQIGRIEQKSVENYYMEMLNKYSTELKPDNKPVSEMNVNQGYVNYIYSFKFRNDLESAFIKVIDERNKRLKCINTLIELMGYKGVNIDFSETAAVLDKIKMYTRRAEEDIKNKNNSIKQINTKIEANLKKKKEAIDELEKAKQDYENVIKDRIPRMYKIIGEFISERDNNLKTFYDEISELEEKQDKIEKSILSALRRSQVKKLKAEIKGKKAEYEELEDKRQKENSVLDFNLREETEEKVLSWMKKVAKIIPEMDSEIKVYNHIKERVPKCETDVQNCTEEHEKSQKEYMKAIEGKYSEEAIGIVEKIKEITSKCSLLDIYKAVFDEAVKEYKESVKGDIKIVGKYHKYDLYAELLFAMRYFNKVHGEKNFICVDEGQDLSVTEYKLIAELNNNNVVFNVYGDTNQLMKQGRGIDNWKNFTSMYNADMYELNENYRNTNQITRFCNTSFNMNVKQTGVDGPRVREISRSELENEINNINIGNDKVAILINRAYKKNSFLAKDKLKDTDIIKTDKIDSGIISLMYVDETKGVEFQKVYVYGDNMNKNEKYIAYTRALSELIIVVPNNLTGMEVV